MLLLLAFASWINCANGVACCADAGSAKAQASAATRHVISFIVTLHSQNQSEGSRGPANAVIALAAQYDWRGEVLDSEIGYRGRWRLWRRDIERVPLAHGGNGKRHQHPRHDLKCG